MPRDANGRPGRLQSLGIALDLLDLVAAHPDSSITALSERAGIAKSTASRTCADLVDAGLLERTERGRVVLGSRLIELGNLARLRRGLSSKLFVALADTCDRVRETVQLAVIRDRTVHYVERVEADRRLRYTAERYRTSAVHTSSCGKVFAAWDADLAERCIRAGLAPATGYTKVLPDVLRDELADVRACGHASQIEEKELGAASLAVPVRAAADGPVLAALGMAGPVRRVLEHRERHVAELQRGAATIGDLVASGEISLPVPR